MLENEEDSYNPGNKGNFLHFTGESLEHYIGEDAEDQSFGYGIGQGHHYHGQKGWNRFGKIGKIDVLDGREHKKTDYDKGWSGSRAGNQEEKRSEKEGYKEKPACGKSRQTRSSTLCHA
jgi:hypothetical protein